MPAHGMLAYATPACATLVYATPVYDMPVFAMLVYAMPVYLHYMHFNLVLIVLKIVLTQQHCQLIVMPSII